MTMLVVQVIMIAFAIFTAARNYAVCLMVCLLILGISHVTIDHSRYSTMIRISLWLSTLACMYIGIRRAILIRKLYDVHPNPLLPIYAHALVIASSITMLIAAWCPLMDAPSAHRHRRNPQEGTHSLWSPHAPVTGKFSALANSFPSRS